MKKFFSEFGTFISKGNALDLAVGIIIGGAFNKIVSSLVKDIIMPLISLIFQTDITQLVWVMRGTRTWDPTTSAYLLSENAVVLYYGSFIQTIIDFLIIALAIFVAIKFINKFKEKIEALKTIISQEIESKEQEQA